jgi:hypothetical protein
VKEVPSKGEVGVVVRGARKPVRPGTASDRVRSLEEALGKRKRELQILSAVASRIHNQEDVVMILQAALRYRVFKEIWAARTMLLSPRQAPRTTDEDFYGLRVT